ncbi:MAG: hypothetical protein M1816_005209 [Peltula sp. TS41687]|nr:MAG: hypothetical protein M1816_005209 [Peltula sp. TS41687]
MLSASQAALLQIYQDPIPSFDHPEYSRMNLGSSRMHSANSQMPMGIPPPNLGHIGLGVAFPNPLANPLCPVLNAPVSSRRGFIFDPPIEGPNKPSPQKPYKRPDPQPTFDHDFQIVSIPPPEASLFVTDSPKKRPTVATFDTSRNPPPKKALFTTFQTTMAASADKENVAPSGNSFNDRQQSSQDQKAPLKALMQSAPIRDKQTKKSKPDEPVDLTIPDPSQMPLVEDDGNKPPYSYATLIGMALLRAPNRRLTLAQIYKWISDSFLFYRTSDAGWQNSIRHNLSLNKAFIKQERPKDDPGKGNYWCIAPGSEGTFLREKQARKSTAVSFTARPPVQTKPTPTATPVPDSQVIDLTRASESQQSPIAGPSSQIQAPVQASVQAPTQALVKAPVKAPVAADLSSDATIPASDIPHDDDEPEPLPVVVAPHQLTSTYPPYSSPIQIQSSPPVSRYSPLIPQEGSPFSSLVRYAAPTGQHEKRPRLSDSGYHSAFNSSAEFFPMSETDMDRPRRSGRVEDEIARMRQSSYESPTKKLRTGGHQPTSQLPSSSPLRQSDESFLPPLTPATTFKVPGQESPAPCPSTRTHLRNHRQAIRAMVGSPLRGVSLLQDDAPWSPVFDMEEIVDFHANANLNDDIFTIGSEVFVNSQMSLLPSMGQASPEKRLMKRPRTDETGPENASPDKRMVKRARLEPPSSSRILADITRNGSNSALVSASNTTSDLQFPFLRSPSFSTSPSKSPTRSGTSGLRLEDLEGFLDARADQMGLGLQQDWTGEDPTRGIWNLSPTRMRSKKTRAITRMIKPATTRQGLL